MNGIKMLGHYACSACQDTWCRELTDQETQAYIEVYPELAEKILAGKITDVDLGETLCDGCEDYYQEEAVLAEAWDAWYAELAAQSDEGKDPAC